MYMACRPSLLVCWMSFSFATNHTGLLISSSLLITSTMPFSLSFRSIYRHLCDNLATQFFSVFLLAFTVRSGLKWRPREKGVLITPMLWTLVRKNVTAISAHIGQLRVCHIGQSLRRQPHSVDCKWKTLLGTCEWLLHISWACKWVPWKSTIPLRVHSHLDSDVLQRTHKLWSVPDCWWTRCKCNGSHVKRQVLAVHTFYTYSHIDGFVFEFLFSG